MPGSQATYTPDSADFKEFYAPNRYCKMWGWVPTGFDTMSEIPVLIWTPGGGWISGDHVLTLPTATLPAPAAVFTKFLDAGFCCVFINWPMGWNGVERLQMWPATNFPTLQLITARAPGWIKTQVIRKLLKVGGFDVPLSLQAKQYLSGGLSSGAHNALWTATLPTGSIPYHRGQPRTSSYWELQADHRYGGVLCEDGPVDFARYDITGGISANAMPLFLDPANVTATPKFAGLEKWRKLAPDVIANFLRNEPENRELAVFSAHFGSWGNGNLLNDPALTKADFLAAWNASDEPLTDAGDAFRHLDPHETGFGAVLEQALENLDALNEVDPADKRWECWWGNAVNNPTGIQAFPAVPLPLGEYENRMLNWATRSNGAGIILPV